MTKAVIKHFIGKDDGTKNIYKSPEIRIFRKSLLILDKAIIKHFSGEDDETRKINPGGEDWKENSEIPGKTSEVIS